MKGHICVCLATWRMILKHLPKRVRNTVLIRANAIPSNLKKSIKRKGRSRFARKHFSRKQLAAQRLFAKRARAGTLRRRKRRR